LRLPLRPPGELRIDIPPGPSVYFNLLRHCYLRWQIDSERRITETLLGTASGGATVVPALHPGC